MLSEALTSHQIPSKFYPVLLHLWR